ncbi:MAG TPA: hypothetical protein VHJ17_13335, partial [Thermomonospora sp.]|nr:hypothetical protein [Thermomonospora sp.]
AADGPPDGDAFLVGDAEGGLVLRSGGTSARGKILYHSWDFTARVNALGARGLRAALPEPPRRIANCLPSADLNGGFLFTHDVCRLAGALTLPVGASVSVADTADTLVWHRVDTLVATPAHGVQIVAALPPGHRLRNLLYLGDVLRPAQREAVEAAVPGLTVRSLAYSTSETGPIGYQCPHLGGGRHHLHEDAVVVEVVEEDTGRPVPDGRDGDVVVTALTGSGMALPRYRIGDRGRVEPGECPCGSRARVLALLGRTRQSIIIDAWQVYSDAFLGALAAVGVTGPGDCQLQVRHDAADYELTLLLAPDVPEVSADAVAAALTTVEALRRVLTGPRCTGFAVRRCPPERFARTGRGKVPLFYQHP